MSLGDGIPEMVATDLGGSNPLCFTDDCCVEPGAHEVAPCIGVQVPIGPRTGMWFNSTTWRSSLIMSEVIMTPIYDVLKNALVDRGWTIDDSQSEIELVINRGGEVREFVHPHSGKRLAWLDAFYAQEAMEWMVKIK